MTKKEAQKQEELYRKAFSDARKDLEETNIYNTEERAKELSSKTLNDMLGFTDPAYILTHNKEKGMVFLAGERLSAEQIINLKNEAEYILSTTLWKVFYNSIGDIARKTMFEKSESFEDMKSGKCMLYNLSLMKNILDLFKAYVVKK